MREIASALFLHFPSELCRVAGQVKRIIDLTQNMPTKAADFCQDSITVDYYRALRTRYLQNVMVALTNQDGPLSGFHAATAFGKLIAREDAWRLDEHLCDYEFWQRVT